MNKDQIEGSWKHFMGTLEEKWGQLTHDDATILAGVRKRLEGSLQERHGFAKASGHDAPQLEGTGRWNTLNANVDSAFNDLRRKLENDEGRSSFTDSRNQSVTGNSR